MVSFFIRGRVSLLVLECECIIMAARWVAWLCLLLSLDQRSSRLDDVLLLYMPVLCGLFGFLGIERNGKRTVVGCRFG